MSRIISNSLLDSGLEFLFGFLVWIPNPSSPPAGRDSRSEGCLAFWKPLAESRNFALPERYLCLYGDLGGPENSNFGGEFPLSSETS